MSEIIAEKPARLERLAKLREAGRNPYPSRVERSHGIAKVLSHFESFTPEHKITIVGRVRALRRHGGVSFLQIEDGTGKMQALIQKDVLGEAAYTFAMETIDMGDFVSASGVVYLTKKGEKSISANEIRIITKALLPLPEKWHGLTDTELRFRKRHLDLISNESVREIFRTRSRVHTLLRKFFDEREYMEVDTPILQPLAGGALAEPFITHHNALGIDLYLRVAPELYLKRLLVGGFERVYEIARCFRNEGIDATHSPEFTQIEFYQAYSSYEDLMKLIEDFFPFLLRGLGKDIKITLGGQDIDFTPPYPRLAFRDAILEYTKVDINAFPEAEDLRKKAREIGCDIDSSAPRGKICDEIYKTFVRPHLIAPTFLIHHPVDLSPLAKRVESDQRYVERCQLVAGGIELTNGFSELNDPIDQRARFEDQERAREAGEKEVQGMDNDFIEALEIGMPPTAGCGIGIERLLCLLTDSHNLKEVIFFPTLRPAPQTDGGESSGK
ncbi:MAG: lysine--tRNA ligase [Patescibacteria group bacterium]